MAFDLAVAAGTLFIVFFKLVFGLTLSITAIYLGITLFDRLTRGIDEWKELKKGNIAVGIVLAGIILSIALIIEGSVSRALDVLSPSLGFPALFISMLIAILEVFVGLLAAIFTVYVSLRVLDGLTPEIEELQELKKGNAAVALVIAMVMVAVALVVRAAVDSLLVSI